MDMIRSDPMDQIVETDNVVEIDPNEEDEKKYF